MKKLSNKQRRFIILRLMTMSQNKRAEYLKKKDIFYQFGENVKWVSNTIPAEPYLVSIGDNVKIAAGVTFITHDIIGGTLALDPNVKERLGKDISFRFHMGKIVVGDSVMIGANTTILYDVKIGSHVIIAAGSVVTKDVPDGTIVGGNPARVIGDYYKYAEKRSKEKNPTNSDTLDEILNYYWGQTE